MHTSLQNGKEHESAPEIAEYDDATESRLVLYAVREAINRMNYACRVVIHTECNYVAAAITRHWPEAWQENSWRNSKGKEIKDAELWNMILLEQEETGHILEAEQGKHEWCEWMRWKLPLSNPLKGTFKKIEKAPQI